MPGEYINGFKSGTFKGHYYEVGGAGRPVIALHGFGESIYAWRHLAPGLAATHQVHLLDLRGHGRSEMPADGCYAPRCHADLVFEYIQHHQLTGVTVMGHSMGGGVALLLALRIMADANTKLAGIVLLDSMFYTQKVPLFISALRTPLLGGTMVNLTPPAMSTDIILRQAIYDKRKITPDMVGAYAAALHRPGGRHALLQTARQVIDTDASIEPQLLAITAPALIIWGENDTIVAPKVAYDIHKLLKRSKVHMLAECGHCPNEEQPEQTLLLIQDFLRGAASSPG
jgi:pimeloyl-ACP methyl ester carboxylesterase